MRDEDYPGIMPEPTAIEQAIKALREAKNRIERQQERIDVLEVKAEAYDTIREILNLRGHHAFGFDKIDETWFIDRAISGLSENSEAGENLEDLDASDLEPESESRGVESATILGRPHGATIPG